MVDKVSVFLAGYRNSTTKSIKLGQVSPNILLQLFAKFGLKDQPSLIEDEDGDVLIHEGPDTNSPFTGLRSARVYEIPFEGKIETAKGTKATPSSQTEEKPKRPPEIRNADIHRALFCCRAVYMPDEDIAGYFNDELKMHNFKNICFSRNGQLRYLIAKCPKEDGRKRDIFVAFKGTTSFQDVISDLDVFPLRSDFEGRCHGGFMKLSKGLPSNAILREFNGHRIVLCGHSLGGAVAQLMGLSMLVQMKTSSVSEATKVNCITFGSPLVVDGGVGAFIERFGMSDHFLNVINRSDPVPRILRLAESIKACGNKLDDAINSVSKYVKPLLDMISVIPLAPVAGAATVAKTILEGSTRASSDLNKSIAENGAKLQELVDIYVPIGWFLFLNAPESMRKHDSPRWEMVFTDVMDTINRRLSYEKLGSGG